MSFFLLVLYAFPLIVFLIGLAGLWKNPSNWRRYLPMCIYFIFIAAYSFTPVEGSNMDLIRYLSNIEAYGKMPFSKVISYEGNVLIARSFLYWVCGSLQVAHMVPAISTTTVYAVAGYITCDTAERYKGTQYIALVLTLQMILLPFVGLLNNVKNVFGLSVVLLAVYLDIVKGKRTFFTWFCYLFGTTMHFSVVAVIAFRLISPLVHKYFEAILICQLFLSAIVLKIHALKSLFAIGGPLGRFLQAIILKFHAYLQNTTGVGAVKYVRSSIFSERTFMVIWTVIAVAIVWNVLRSRNEWFQDDNRWYVVIGMVASMAVSLHFLMLVPNYWRFSAALNVAIGTLLIPLLRGYGKLPPIPNALALAGLLTFPFIFMFHSVDYLRVFYTTHWIADTLTTNYLTILYDLVKGISAL